MKKTAGSSFQNNCIQTKQLMLKLVLGLTLCLGISTSNAAVINIEVTSVVGDGFVNNQNFFDQNNALAHFSLDTLDLGESIITNQPRGAWLDLVIEITRNINDQGDQMLAIDKDVTNNTIFPWHLFHMAVGTGVGDNFVATPGDGISFKDNPAPREEFGKFQLIPPSLLFDNDNLWFKSIGGNDLQPGDVADFWLGLNVTEDNFVDDLQNNISVATITLRQHADIPEPNILILMGLGLLGLSIKKRVKT